MRRTVLVVAVLFTLLSLSGDRASVSTSATAAESSSKNGAANGGATTKKITPEAKKSIGLGTKWLVEAIRRDGGVGPDKGQPPEIGCTAMVGLALLSQGNTLDKGPNARELRRVFDYLMHEIESVGPNEVPVESNTLIQRKIGKYAPVFLLTLFLSQIHGEEEAGEEIAVRKALTKLARFISSTQQKDGTWGDNSWAPVLGTVLGWESLRAAASAGIVVEASAENIGANLIEKLKQRNPNEAGNWMFTFYKETASLRVLHSLGYKNDPVFKDSLERVLKLGTQEQRLYQSAGGEEYIAFYLVTELMMQEQKKNALAAQWYPHVRDKLISIQNKDGTWTGHHCITSRTFCTAAALLTLQTPDLALPTSDL